MSNDLKVNRLTFFHHPHFNSGERVSTHEDRLLGGRKLLHHFGRSHDFELPRVYWLLKDTNIVLVLIQILCDCFCVSDACWGYIETLLQYTTRNLKNTYTDVRKNLPVCSVNNVMFVQVCVFHCWVNIRIPPKNSSSSLVLRPVNLTWAASMSVWVSLIFLIYGNSDVHVFFCTQPNRGPHAFSHEWNPNYDIDRKILQPICALSTLQANVLQNTLFFGDCWESYMPRLKSTSHKVSSSSFRWYLGGHVDVHLNGLHLIPTRQRPATPTGTCEPELEEFWTWFCADEGIIMTRTESPLTILPVTVRPSSSILIHHFAPLHITRRRFAFALKLFWSV